MTLLIWQQTSRVSSTLSLFRLVPFGMILLINLWLFSTWGFCHDAWGSQKNTWVRINPGRVCSKALGFLNSTPLSVRITPKSLLNSAVPSVLLRVSNTWITLSWVPSFIRKISMKLDFLKIMVRKTFPFSRLPFTVSISTIDTSGLASTKELKSLIVRPWRYWYSSLVRTLLGRRSLYTTFLGRSIFLTLNAFLSM